MAHDGRLELVLGDPGAGKDSFIYWMLHNRPFVLVQTAPNNETMDAMPYVRDTDKQLEKATKVILPAIYRPEGYVLPGTDEHIYNFAVFFRKDYDAIDVNPKIWPLMYKAPTLWLGDINYWARDWHRWQRFDVFMRDIRGRDQLVMGSTHKAKADIPPVAYEYARKIYWVGPFADDDTKLQVLFGKKSAGLFTDIEDFREKITSLEKFDWANPNPDRSVLTIKDQTG